MRLVPLLAAGAGVALVGGLIVYFGAGAVLRALVAVGLVGFAIVCAIHFVLIGVMGVAWRALLPGGRSLVLIWGRFVRDGGSEMLPLSQVGGYVLGARAVILAGVPGTLAVATTIADVTLEFIAQLVYTGIGLVLLAELRPGTAIAVPVTVGLVVATAVATAFLLVQRGGFPFLDRVAGILGRGWAEKTAAGTAALSDAMAAIYRRHGGVAVCAGLHLVCWVASAVEVWVMLQFAGAPLSFAAVLTLESLLHAARTLAFIIPNAVGVQEGAYVVLGATFGLTPEIALALSLLKRARDLVLGLPAIAAWQMIESGRLWRRSGSSAAEPGEPAPAPRPRRK